MQERQAYLSELLGAASKIKYERILQAPTEAEAFDGTLYDSTYIDHFCGMVSHSGCTLRVARPMVPITFAIIDGKHLAIEICVTDPGAPGGATWKPHDGFILRDAPPDVIGCFTRLVEELQRKSSEITVWPFGAGSSRSREAGA